MCAACWNSAVQLHVDGVSAPSAADGGPHYSAVAIGTSPDIVEIGDAAASVATSFSIAAGQTLQGILGAGDTDWFRVTLSAGQTYSFMMVGTGVDDVHDPFLALYDSAGTTLLVSNDDAAPSMASAFSFTPNVSGIYFIAASAYANAAADTGQYGVSITAGAKPDIDIQMAAGIIDAEAGSASVPWHFAWNSTPGSGATVTIGFRQTDDGLESNFSQFTAAQRTAVMAVAQYYSDVCGLNFSFINPGGVTDNATILFSNYNSNDGSGGYAQYPGSAAAASQDGNIHINLAGGNSTTSVAAGSYSFSTLMHELGHAVGLSHPGLYNAGQGQTISYGNSAQFLQDTHQYSVMSYFDEANSASSWGSYADTLMMADILALQNIYGANYATRATDTVYGYNATAGSIFDFASNTRPALCIWDGGGTDTLDCSAHGGAQTINLGDGTFSSVLGLVANVSIAVNAVIENAIGGSGSDTIIGNEAGNWLQGGSGADSLFGGEGSDELNGGTGADFLYGGLGDDTYYVDNIADFIDEGTTFPSIPGGGFDYLYSTAQWYYESSHSVEQLAVSIFNSYSLSTIVGGGGANSIFGNAGNNNLYGNWGNDWIYAGAGIDNVDLQGNPANIATEVDTVYMAPGSGWDVIWNFTPGVDNVDLSAYGLGNWATFLTLGHGTDTNGNAWVSIAGGDMLMFVGVNFSALSAGDFIFV